MNILVLNGSPRGEKSNTLKITNAFLDGIQTQGKHEITTVLVSAKKIGHCLGCFSCWKDTPGTCAIKDDMTDILAHIIKADLIIWSFPLYYFSMPSKLKALMDRMIPLALPFIDARLEGGATHPARYDLSHQRTVLISTGGLYSTKNNYEAIDAQFDIAFGKGKVTKILCPEGELFSQATLRLRTEEYLTHVRAAGAQYAESGAISESTQNEISKLLYPVDLYTTMANASWGIDREESQCLRINTDTGYNEKLSTTDGGAKAKRDPSTSFLIQMAALYNPRDLAGQEAMLEFHFSDLGSTHRLHLGKKTCTILNPDSPEFTTLPKGTLLTRIETPFSVWQEIGEGTYDGPTAMMEGKYKVLGNFDLMLKMDTLFAGPDRPERTNSDTTVTASKKRNMALVILPWLPLWVALPISATAGLIAGLGALVLFQLAGLKWKIDTHERITLTSVTLIILGIAAGVSTQILIPLTYLGFGLQWLLSCFCAVPLTAHYSGAGYGGDSALKNPLFIKTNRIITAVWGIVYIATACWTGFLLATPLALLTGAINSISPALCGLWTAWFPKWYIAKAARGK